MIVEILRFVPRRALTRLVGRAARTPIPRPLRSPIFRGFAARVGVNLAEIDRPLAEFPTFQDFFARRLRAGARTVGGGLVAPVDGTVVAAGEVVAGRLVQVKGCTYALADLLGGDEDAAPYLGGRYATLYLHPRDYHRIHAPIDGAIVASRHVPGGLYPVNAEACAKVPGLFASNERIVAHLQGELGRVAVVMVAALGVGTVRAFWDDGAWRDPERRRYAPACGVRRGEEIATFLMGSTVVLVAERGVPLRALAEGATVRMGEPLAEAPDAREVAPARA